MAYVVARTVAGGKCEGLASCLGTGVGGMLHVSAAALGLSVLVAESAAAFAVVKYVGVAYLLYLGLRLLLSRAHDVQFAEGSSREPRRAFLEGILVEAFNVKTALFFLAFLPQFVQSTQPLAAQLVVLGTVCVALNTFVDVIAVFASTRLLETHAARTARARLLTRASGITMLGLGAYLALARREA